MPIKDLASMNLVTVDRGASIQYAAQLMRNRHVGCLVVTESNGINKPIGVLTDRDIVIAIAADNLPVQTTRVDDIMTTMLATASVDEDITRVIDKMEVHGVRRIVIVDEMGSPVGLVSIDDVLQFLAKEMNGLGRLVSQQVGDERIFRPQNQFLLY